MWGDSDHGPETDPVNPVFYRFATRLQSLTMHGKIDWQEYAYPVDITGWTSTAFKLVNPISIQGKEYQIVVYTRRPAGHDEDLAGAHLEITSLPDGNTEKFSGYYEAGPLHCLIKSSIEEKRLKEGSPEAKGNSEERRVQLLETLSRAL